MLYLFLLYRRCKVSMVSFVMFFGCRVSGEKNDFKSYNNGIYAGLYHRRKASMVSFVMFFGCRVSGEKNDFKSYHNGIYAVIIAERRRPWQEAQGQNARLRHCSPPPKARGAWVRRYSAERGYSQVQRPLSVTS